MNDKIYEFATRAGLITFESIHDSMAVTPSIESVAKARKFAEMIVRECLSEVVDEVQYTTSYELADQVTKRVKQHFGVEE